MREYYSYNIIDKIKKTLKFYFLGLGLIMVTVFIIIIPLDSIVVKYFHFESIKGLMSEAKSKYDDYPICITVFLGPFIEEILFRLSLVVNKNNISIFFGFLTHEILRKSFVKFDFQNKLYFSIVIVSVIAFLFARACLTTKIIDSIQKRQKKLILLSIFFFGLIHVINFKILHWELALLYPFFVLPQMIMAYFITDLRLRYGFFWGLSLHSLFNFIAVIF